MKEKSSSAEHSHLSLFAAAAPLSEAQQRSFTLFFRIIGIGTVLSMLGMLLYYIYAFASLSNGSKDFDWLLGIFSDFVSVMSFSLGENPYAVDGSSYPPIAIMILYPFAWICKDVILANAALETNVDAFTARVILDPSFWVAFILFFAVCSTTIVLILIKMYRLDQKNAFRTAIIVWLGAPFIYIVMRGNTIYFALIFLLLFLLLYRSERPWVRELSYIFLTLAGAIKIYPLFFGVFLLHRKKIFACVRIALYSALSFFLSFFFFEEGWDGLMRFIKNLFLFSDSDTRMVGGTNVSLNSILYKLVAPFSQDAADSAIFQKIQLGLVILIFLVCTILAVRTKSNFSRSVLAAAVVILVPSVSYFYTISFAIIPLMNFFQSFDSMTRKKQIFYLIAFAFLFFSPFLLSQNFALHGVIILVMMIIEAVEIIRNEGFLRAKKQIEQ